VPASAAKGRSPSFQVPQALYWLLAAVHVVCPLLFFTDLTRNPYVTQIALLHGGLILGFLWLIVAGFQQGVLEFSFTPLTRPVAAFVALALATSGISWLVHPALRASIMNEGGRVSFFLVVNAYLAFLLAGRLSDPVWDARFRRLAMLVGVMAGGYGILQYMGHEIIWPQSLNPYSGRPVSTFGNPNFLSSYLVMLLPLALAEGVAARTRTGKLLCAGAFLIFAVALISTFTRSSWIGAAAAVGILLVFAWRAVRASRGWVVGLLLAVALATVLWPSSPLAQRSTKPLDRMTELVQGITKEKAYGSWHQRLLIWSCAWDMVKERPVLGKGWGVFELFYPFYQGYYLSDEVFRQFRTHANNAHNIIFELWAQVGTAGLGLFLWLCVLMAELARRRIPLLAEKDQIFAWASFAAGVGMLADNFFGNVSVFFAVPAFLFFWLMGQLDRALAPTETRALSMRSPGALAAGAVVLILGAAGLARVWHYWRGEVYYFDGFKKAKGGDLRKAIDALEAAYQERRWEVNNNYELANAYARLAQWARDNNLPAEHKHALEQALHAYDEALNANGGYDEIYFNKGTILAQIGRRDEAVQNYRVTLLINPLAQEAYKALGNAYLSEEKDHAKGVEVFERAVFFFPNDREFWNNLGYLYNKLGRNEEALAAFTRSIEVDFQFEVAWKNLAVAIKALGRNDHPLMKVPGLWAQTQTAIQQNRWKDARASAEALRALLPKNIQATIILANICARGGDEKTALSLYDEVLAVYPYHRDARINKGKTLAHGGRRPEALAIFSGLHTEFPNDAEITELWRSVGGA